MNGIIFRVHANEIDTIVGTFKSPGSMAILAIASIAFAIYQQFDDKRPSLLVKTEAVSSVFSVLQPIGGLQISYAGQDLRNSKQSLWVITVSITNVGASSIRKGDYDDSIPFGLSVNHGQIVESPTITTENIYLKNNLKPTIQSNRIVFSPVIFEPHDSFRLRILVLGPDGTIPSVTGFAKIAGLQQIEHITPEAPESKKSAWAMITDADANWVQVVRPIFYGLGGLFGISLIVGLFTAVVLPFSQLRSWKNKQARRKQITVYKPNDNLGWETRVLGEIYIEYGEWALAEIKRVIKNVEKRCQLIKEFESINMDGKYNKIIEHETALQNSQILGKLKETGLLSIDGIMPTWPSTLIKSLEDMAGHLAIDLNQQGRPEVNVMMDRPMPM